MGPFPERMTRVWRNPFSGTTPPRPNECGIEFVQGFLFGEPHIDILSFAKMDKDVEKLCGMKTALKRAFGRGALSPALITAPETGAFPSGRKWRPQRDSNPLSSATVDLA